MQILSYPYFTYIYYMLDIYISIELSLIIGCSACIKQCTPHPLEAEVINGAVTQRYEVD